MNEPLGKKIKKIREIKGFSQQYVAAKLKISQERYSYLENKQKHIDEEQLKKIAGLFEVSLQYLTTFDTEKILNVSAGHSTRLDTIDECIIIIHQLKEKINHIEKQLQHLGR